MRTHTATFSRTRDGVVTINVDVDGVPHVLNTRTENVKVEGSEIVHRENGQEIHLVTPAEDLTRAESAGITRTR